MPSGFLLVALAVALLGGAAVLAFESPTRAAGGLITAFVGVAAAAGALMVPLVPGFVLWVGAGGVGVLLLGGALVLNLSAEERGRRSWSVRAVLGTFASLALLVVLARLPMPALERTESAQITAAAVADELTGALAPAVGVALTALAASVLVTLALVRRRT